MEEEIKKGGVPLSPEEMAFLKRRVLFRETGGPEVNQEYRGVACVKDEGAVLYDPKVLS